jgi:hypothetical protein
MIAGSNCACPLCRLEMNLMTRLSKKSSATTDDEILGSSAYLSAFHSVSELLGNLKVCGQDPDGHRAADRIFAELLRTPHGQSTIRVDEIFILAFIPTIHLTMRRVLERYPALSQDDVAHQMLLFLLQFLRSDELKWRESYFAFAISRKIRRSTFEWAKRECRVRAADSPEEFPEIRIESSLEAFERLAILRHFLNSCVSRGWIDSDELNLLIQFKLDGLSGDDLGLSSNALRQRIKRLVAKLRRLAREHAGPSVDIDTEPRI